jgi:hypothetical protein
MLLPKPTDNREDWYKRRDELRQDMVFVMYDGSIVKLDRRVPGDGTQWYVADYFHGHWSYEDSTIEPSELKHRAEYMEDE